MRASQWIITKVLAAAFLVVLPFQNCGQSGYEPVDSTSSNSLGLQPDGSSAFTGTGQAATGSNAAAVPPSTQSCSNQSCVSLSCNATGINPTGSVACSISSGQSTAHLLSVLGNDPICGSVSAHGGVVEGRCSSYGWSFDGGKFVFSASLGLESIGFYTVYVRGLSGQIASASRLVYGPVGASASLYRVRDLNNPNGFLGTGDVVGMASGLVVVNLGASDPSYYFQDQRGNALNADLPILRSRLMRDYFMDSNLSFPYGVAQIEGVPVWGSMLVYERLP